MAVRVSGGVIVAATVGRDLLSFLSPPPLKLQANPAKSSTVSMSASRASA